MYEMKRILHDTINQKPYLGVEVDETMLKLVLLQYQKDWTINIDKRVIPQLIEFLQEATNNCAHPNATREEHITGEGAMEYVEWIDYECPDCGKKWTENE
jgi:hypothetical protein